MTPMAGVGPESSLLIVAPNGARRGHADHPALPITPAQMAACAKECLQAGAGMIHVHARDADGQHSLDRDINQRFYDAVCDAVGDDMLVQLTTEAVGRYEPAQQMALINRLQPMAASFALRELIPDDTAQSHAQDFFCEVLQQDCLAQFILYSPAELQRYHALKQSGMLPDCGHHLLFVLGRDVPQHPSALSGFVNAHSDNTPWAVCAFGAVEFPAAAAALAMGGDVRVGFENNLTLRNGALAANNAQLVSQARELALLLSRPAWVPSAFKQHCMHSNSAR